MTTDIISIDRNIISNFIKENIEYDSFYGIENELLMQFFRLYLP